MPGRWLARVGPFAEATPASRRRTAGTLPLVAAPAAVGLALVADPVAVLLLGAGYAPADYAATAFALPLRAITVAIRTG